MLKNSWSAIIVTVIIVIIDAQLVVWRAIASCVYSWSGNMSLGRSRIGARPVPGHSQELWVKVPVLEVQWGVGR